MARFGQDVSPRWCVAQEAIIATVHDGAVLEREVLPLGECSNFTRLGKLHARGVSLLVCGAFDRRYLPLAERLGVRVVWGVTGSAVAALSAYAGTSAADGAARPAEGDEARRDRARAEEKT